MLFCILEKIDILFIFGGTMKFSIKKLIIILALLAITAVGSTAAYASYMKNKDIIKTELYPIEQEFLINIKSKNANKILKTSITLEITGKKSAELLTENQSKVSDTIINTLSSKTESELGVEKREELKKDLSKNLNGILKEDIVVDIFFQGFLIN